MSRNRALSTVVIIVAAITLLVVPAISAPRTTPTTIDPSGNTVKIDSAANTVKIDGAANNVATATQHQSVQLWSTNQIVASGGFVHSAYVNCAGYKELRVVIGSNMLAYNASLWAIIEMHPGTSGGGYAAAGTVNFGAPAHLLSDQANMTLTPGFCIFTIPVLSDTMHFLLHNDTGSSVTLYNWSYAYLVN